MKQWKCPGIKTIAAADIKEMILAAARSCWMGVFR